MICIYHSRDLDGYSSGAIVKKKFPDAILIGYDYGQELKLGGINPAEHNVIMIDVVLDEMTDMFALAKKCKTLTWIDHHLSAIRKYEAVKDQAPDNFIAVLEDGIAACEGGWKYLFPNERTPKAIELLGKYDTWRNQDKEKWEMEILPFQYGMRLKCNSAESFPMELLDGPLHQSPTSPADKYMVERVIQNGHVIVEYQAKINETQCRKAFEFEFEGMRAICLNGGGFSSDVFKSVYDESKHDVMMPFQFDGKQWIFSMYTTKDIDLSVIARKWGGGGHKQACGFQVPDLGLVFTFLSKSEIELIIKQLPGGPISCEMNGEQGEVAVMLCRAMVGSTDVAAIVCSAVPTYLDSMNLDRAGYCKTVMEAVGGK